MRSISWDSFGPLLWEAWAAQGAALGHLLASIGAPWAPFGRLGGTRGRSREAEGRHRDPNRPQGPHKERPRASPARHLCPKKRPKVPKKAAILEPSRCENTLVFFRKNTLLAL